MDAAQQAALQQEMAHLTEKYFTPTSTAPGTCLDPDGNPSRASAEEGSSGAGDQFPVGLKLLDSAGVSVDLSERLRRGPLIVVFFRGKWCTLCTLALRHLSQCLPIFRDQYGADIVAISGQLPQHNQACEAANQLKFPVYCDKGLELASQLGICHSLTPQEARFYDFICKPSFDDVYGDGHRFRLPLPATFVLAPETARIGYAFVDQDLSKRSRLLRIEAALQDLSGAGLAE